MSRHDRFEALAKEILLVTVRKGEGYTPPSNAHMVVDTALAIAEDFLDKLRLRRDEKDNFDGLLAKEVELMQNGNKIKAIKLVKDRTGMSLLEAKAHVDKIESQLDV